MATPVHLSAGPGAGSLLSVVGYLVLVLALIALASWLAKRSRLLGQGGDIKITSSLGLGVRERLVVVEVDGRRWLLGVTPNQIHPISELDAASQVEPEYRATTSVDFASRLKELLRQGGR